MNLQEKLDRALNKFKNEKVLRSKDFKAINRVADISFTKKAVIFPDKDSEPLDGPITIIPISDAHLGSLMCNKKKILETIELILNNDNVYTILMGDQLETATKQSVGLGVYEEEMNLEEQIATAYAYLKPLADAGKILGALTGNHEMRVAYTTSLNPTKLLAQQLGIPYLGYQAYISLRVGTQVYSIFAHHGTGGGSTPAGKLNAVRKLNRVAMADVYLSGHTHARLYDYDVIMNINHTTGEIEPIKRHYATCGSFLEYWGGYAEMKLLPPTSTGVVAISFDPEEKNVEVKL